LIASVRAIEKYPSAATKVAVRSVFRSVVTPPRTVAAAHVRGKAAVSR